MNATLTRTKQNLSNVCWEPFATSTPLKKLKPNSETENILQKHLLKIAPAGNVDKIQNDFTNSNILQIKSPNSRYFLSKRARSTSSAYFDILTTSSSDEDGSNENKKGPVIKLSSRKKTRSFLGNKKSGSEDTGILNKINPRNKISDTKKLKTKTEKHVISAANDLEPEIRPLLNSKEKVQCFAEELPVKNSSFSSDEGNKIFGETKLYKNVTKYKKLGTHEIQESEELPKKKEMNDMPGKSVKTYIFEGKKGPYKTLSENNELTKAQKKEPTRITNTIGPVTKTRRCKDKPPKETLKPDEIIETALHLQQSKCNLSHQLFSESKEQEFINKLDLTKEETDKAAEIPKCLTRQKENDLFLKPFMSPHPSIQDNCNNEIKHEKTKRRKQAPKKFWLLENTSEKSLVNVTTTKKQCGIKNNDQMQEILVLKKCEEGSTKNNHEYNKEINDHLVKSQKTANRGKKKAGGIIKGKLVEPNKILNDCELKNAPQNFILSQLPSETYATENTESKQDVFATTKNVNTVTFERPVFQRLNELSYKGNEAGCSVEQCWNLHNFKCGIFMLKVRAQYACRTLHKNSHLGGVLVKGALRMKIGDKDLDLKEGDMAFVPPLTTWQASNIGDCDSVFYYWCGKFVS